MATATEPAAPTQPAEKTSSKKTSSKKTSSKKTSSKKVKALRLTLGGAPKTWHILTGVGYVHPSIPSPIGEPGEPTLEVAKALDADEGCEVELIEITAAEATKARQERELARGAGIEGARETRQGGKEATAAEGEQFSNEVAAATGKE